MIVAIPGVGRAQVGPLNPQVRGRFRSHPYLLSIYLDTVILSFPDTYVNILTYATRTSPSRVALYQIGDYLPTSRILDGAIADPAYQNKHPGRYYNWVIRAAQTSII
jgi:hypothetical protein